MISHRQKVWLLLTERNRLVIALQMLCISYSALNTWVYSACVLIFVVAWKCCLETFWKSIRIVTTHSLDNSSLILLSIPVLRTGSFLHGGGKQQSYDFIQIESSSLIQILLQTDETAMNTCAEKKIAKFWGALITPLSIIYLTGFSASFLSQTYKASEMYEQDQCSSINIDQAEKENKL